MPPKKWFLSVQELLTALIFVQVFIFPHRLHLDLFTTITFLFKPMFRKRYPNTGGIIWSQVPASVTGDEAKSSSSSSTATGQSFYPRFFLDPNNQLTKQHTSLAYTATSHQGAGKMFWQHIWGNFYRRLCVLTSRELHQPVHLCGFE